MSEIPSFSLAGTELNWPIGSAAGMTNHPDIDIVARRFEEYCGYGLGFVTLGSMKLGQASGGNAHINLPNGKWVHSGGDEAVDVDSGYGYNSKGLPGPGLDAVIDRIGDFVDLAKTKDTEITLSVSPNTNIPLEEIDELLRDAEIALDQGVLLVEFNLSCPNIPGKPAFYKDVEAVNSFYSKVIQYKSKFLNKHGHPAIYPKFGPMEQTPDEFQLRSSIWQGTTVKYGTFGGIISSNTVGGQQPRSLDGELLIQVNEGKAGASGPALKEEGWRQQALWEGISRTFRSFENTGEIVSVLGIDSGQEVFRRLRLGAASCQLASVLYWPELVGEETAGAVVEKIKKQFVDSVNSAQNR